MGNMQATCMRCILVPGDACLRGTAFRLRASETGRMKKLRAVIGAVICQRSRANARSGHEVTHNQSVLRASTDTKWFRVPVERMPCVVRCCAGSSG